MMRRLAVECMNMNLRFLSRCTQAVHNLWGMFAGEESHSNEGCLARQLSPDHRLRPASRMAQPPQNGQLAHLESSW